MYQKLRHLTRAAFHVGFALFCAGPTTSWAASFNCARATTAHEHHICDNSKLNAADTAMGDAYRVAAATFPVKGAVLAVQRRFLAVYDLCDKPNEMTCAAALEDQINKLRSMVNAAVYASSSAGASFEPEDAVLWTSLGGDQAVLHYFGVYMPDMTRPAPFPRGFVCDGVVTLTRTAKGYENHADGNDIMLTESGVSPNISCSPRNGIFAFVNRVRNGQAAPAGDATLSGWMRGWHQAVDECRGSYPSDPAHARWCHLADGYYDDLNRQGCRLVSLGTSIGSLRWSCPNSVFGDTGQ